GAARTRRPEDAGEGGAREDQATGAARVAVERRDGDVVVARWNTGNQRRTQGKGRLYGAAGGRIIVGDNAEPARVEQEQLRVDEGARAHGRRREGCRIGDGDLIHVHEGGDEDVAADFIQWPRPHRYLCGGGQVARVPHFHPDWPGAYAR